MTDPRPTAAALQAHEFDFFSRSQPDFQNSK
jgi:hypothetical protein